MRRALSTAVFSLLALFACAARAEACTCVGPDSPCVAFGRAPAVFVGTVTLVITRAK